MDKTATSASSSTNNSVQETQDLMPNNPTEMVKPGTSTHQDAPDQNSQPTKNPVETKNAIDSVPMRQL